MEPTKAWCSNCKNVTDCEWRWNDTEKTCADLCCTDCHYVLVCAHKFSAPLLAPIGGAELTEEALELIDAAARRSYRKHHSSVRGQQLTAADSWEWHLIQETRAYVLAAQSAPFNGGGSEPVATDACAQDVFERGQSIGLFDIPKATANAICSGIALITGARVDWHYVGGRVHMKALAAPQPSAKALTDERILAEWDKAWDSATTTISIRKVVCATVRALLAAEQPSEDKRDALAEVERGFVKHAAWLTVCLRTESNRLDDETRKALDVVENDLAVMRAMEETSNG